MSVATVQAWDREPGAFLDRCARALAPRPPGPDEPTANPRGDHSLDPDGSAVVPPPPHRRAAVLVPIVTRAAGLHLVLTQRAAHLRDHSGQIALPGGKIDPAETPREAALREANEEIGLDPAAVRPLGYLDPYLSATGFLVNPMIGLVDPAAHFRPNPAEVAEIFEVPLPFLMDRERYQLRSREWQGRTRYFYALPFGERMIWGVTAGILNNMRERLSR